MRRFAAILFILTMSIFAGSARGGEFGWTLNASASDPLASTGAPAVGLVNVYLWYDCTNVNGLASAEFAVAGSAVPISFTAANGFLNAGGPADLLLAVYQNDFIGYASDGSAPCASVENLCIVAIDGRSWASVKSLYR